MSDNLKLLEALIDRDPMMQRLYQEFVDQKMTRAEVEFIRSIARTAYGAGVTAAKRRPGLVANVEALGYNIK